jgi:cytochrome c oxidase subunit 4
MADAEHSEHGSSLFTAYMVVACALAVFTATSFGVNAAVRAGVFGHGVGFALILGVAIVKATLVAMYFMHLKWDWKFLYFLIIPVFIMGTMMMIVLLPDILLNPSHDLRESYEIAREADHQ